MKHQFVSSSNVESVGYDPDAQKLQVQMRHGKLYEFDGVSPDMHKQLLASPSIGSYLHQNIKNNFRNRVVEK